MAKEPKKPEVDDEDEEGSPTEEATESTQEAKAEGDDTSGEGEDYKGTDAKVPEALQKEAIALVQSCTNEQCLDFIMSEVSEMRKKLMSSQKKSGMMTDNFDTVGMPE